MVYDGIERDARLVLRDLVPIENVVQSKDGRSYMMRLRPYRTIENRIDGIVLTFVDISGRLTAEKQLRDSEDRYRTLFNSIDEGFCVIEMIHDAQGRAIDYRLIDVNAAFERQTGLSGVIDKTMRSLVPDHEDHWFQSYDRVLRTGRAERFESPAKALGRYYEVFAFPVGRREDNKVGLLFNDVSERKQAETHLKLMVSELNHRVKNTLAVVQAIAQQSFSKNESVQSGRVAFEGRLAALAAAHNLLTRTHWEKTSLHELAAEVVSACSARADRFTLSGPQVYLQPGQALSIVMALHELCTNAMKYGALSDDKGKVRLEWSLQGDTPSKLKIEWQESDGPPVAPPIHRGFGSRMVERALAYELNGTVSLEFRHDGVVCIIEAPADEGIGVVGSLLS
jgi:two-component system CheB/CheR fusion protein